MHHKTRNAIFLKISCISRGSEKSEPRKSFQRVRSCSILLNTATTTSTYPTKYERHGNGVSNKFTKSAKPNAENYCGGTPSFVRN